MPPGQPRCSRATLEDGDKGARGIDTDSIVLEGPFTDVVGVRATPSFSTDSFDIIVENFSHPSTPRRRSAPTRRKSRTHIPRPSNAFMLFRSWFIQSGYVSAQVEMNHSTLSKIIGITWRKLPEDERQAWRVKAKDALAEHKRNFPTYVYRPKRGHKTPNATDVGSPPKNKRKVREAVYQDERRCEKIAELLAEGKAGAELDQAIQQFDKHHIPEIVTRFEEPVTACTYASEGSSPSGRSPTESAEKPSGQPSAPEYVNQPRRAGSSTPNDIDDSFALARAGDELIASQSPEPFSFQSALDFDSFSFSNISSPESSESCDPLLSSFEHNTLALTEYAPMAVEPTDINPLELAFLSDGWRQHGHEDSTDVFGDGFPHFEYPASVSAFSFEARGFYRNEDPEDLVYGKQ